MIEPALCLARAYRMAIGEGVHDTVRSSGLSARLYCCA
jgi:hypothetical protein